MLSDAASTILVAAVENGTHLVFHCMYSRERGPRAAQAAKEAHPGLRVSILRGGFQQCVAQLLDGDTDARGVFESLRLERWTKHSSQGLVWWPDVDPVRFALEELSLQDACIVAVAPDATTRCY